VVAVGIGVARPGSASAALGNAVVLRMKNMEQLQAAHRLTPETAFGRSATLYMPLRRIRQPRYRRVTRDTFSWREPKTLGQSRE
jgi:hypothetical protein